jgi:hypothetical protein
MRGGPMKGFGHEVMEVELLAVGADSACMFAK